MNNMQQYLYKNEILWHKNKNILKINVSVGTNQGWMFPFMLIISDFLHFVHMPVVHSYQGCTRQIPQAEL